MRGKFFLIAIAGCLIGCTNVDFDSYFPSDQKPLSNMDSDFVGKYYYMDSVIGKKGEECFFNSRYYASTPVTLDSIKLFSAELAVTDVLVHYSLNFAAFYKIDKVDTSLVNKKFKYKNMFVEGAYLVHKESYADTLLNLNRNDKLFLYKNCYYLNHHKKDISGQDAGKLWSIYQFERCGPGLFSLNRTNEQDYKLLFDTTKKWQPILPVAHLSNKAFKNFVEKGGFHEKYRLIKFK